MSLCSDLSRLIRGQFDKHGICYDHSMALHELAARYFEMNMRRIQPTPRQVHFSDQTHDSLSELSRRGKDDTSVRDAWAAVFRLRQLLVEGANVNALLSKNIRSATGWDGLLWHYGMHHFHLGSETDKDGFVDSGHLLFAIVAPLDAYFVDIRPHPPPRGVEWVSQELPRIVHSNWPKLIEANVLHGIHGTEMTDEEIHELSSNNFSYTMNIDGKAIAPLRGGQARDGSSVLCTVEAGRLLKELRSHEEVLRSEDVRHAVARDMQARGVDAGPTLEFELAFLEDLTLTPELLAVLTAETCISRNSAGGVSPSSTKRRDRPSRSTTPRWPQNQTITELIGPDACADRGAWKMTVCRALA